MKKLLACLLCLLLIVPPVFAEGKTFSDVPDDAWYTQYVTALAERNVVGGYPDGTFGPQREVRVDEALKLILLAAGYPQQAPLMGEGWASGYFSFAVRMGFLPLETDLTRPITREEVGMLAARAMGISSDGPSPFPDVDRPELTALWEKEIILGIEVDGTALYVPDKTLTRAEASAIVWRMNEAVLAAPPLPEEQPPEEELPAWLNLTAEQFENDYGLTMGAGGTYVSPSEENPDLPPPSQEDTGGKIRYRDRLLDILEGVPVFSFDPNSFYLENGRMRCSDPSTELVYGIDVSSHQGVIDWNRVKADGVSFAMLRVGYRGYTVGNLNKDNNFDMNLRNALAAGVEVGAYVFSQAINEKEAVEEADLVIESLKGYDVTYPVVFDWEVINSQNARTNGLSTKTLMACTRAFCDRVRQAGYTPMVYFSEDWGYLKYDLSQISDVDYWLAQYKEQPDFYYDFAMWQYTSKGSVDGITGNVDLDVVLLHR